MLRRLVSLILLLSVPICFGGLGQFLHEREFHSDHAHVSAGDAKEHAPGHSGHDHDRCPTCQLLAAARINRLPGLSIVILSTNAPTRIRPVAQAAPPCLFVHAPSDARGPPLVFDV